MSTALMFLPFLVPSPEHLWASKEEKAHLMSHTPGHPWSKLDRWVGSLCLNGQRSCTVSLRHCQALAVTRRELGLSLPALLLPSLPAPAWVRPAGLPLPHSKGNGEQRGCASPQCLAALSDSSHQRWSRACHLDSAAVHAASSTKTPSQTRKEEGSKLRMAESWLPASCGGAVPTQHPQHTGSEVSA